MTTSNNPSNDTPIGETSFGAAEMLLRHSRRDIGEIKARAATKTTHLVLLTFATFGIYPILWLSRNLAAIDGPTNRKTADFNYLVWIAVCTGWGLALQTTGSEEWTGVGVLSTLAANVLLIIWAFKARAALQDYALNDFGFKLEMNRFYTLTLNIFYVNYCINELPEVYRREMVLRQKTSAH